MPAGYLVYSILMVFQLNQHDRNPAAPQKPAGCTSQYRLLQLAAHMVSHNDQITAPFSGLRYDFVNHDAPDDIDLVDLKIDSTLILHLLAEFT